MNKKEEKKKENKERNIPKDHQESTKIFITPEDLAARWKMSAESLSQWRWNGKTPPYLKMGKKILYDLEAIERFEAQQVRYSTSQKDNREQYTYEFKEP